MLCRNKQRGLSSSTGRSSLQQITLSNKAFCRRSWTLLLHDCFLSCGATINPLFPPLTHSFCLIYIPLSTSIYLLPFFLIQLSCYFSASLLLFLILHLCLLFVLHWFCTSGFSSTFYHFVFRCLLPLHPYLLSLWLSSSLRAVFWFESWTDVFKATGLSVGQLQVHWFSFIIHTIFAFIDSPFFEWRVLSSDAAPEHLEECAK